MSAEYRRTFRSKFRVVTSIPENDEWEEQELISGAEWDTLPEAEAERDTPLPKDYPEGATRYVESMTYSDWSKHG